MKHLKDFLLFEKFSSELSEDDVRFLNDVVEGEWEVNPDTGLIDVNGNVDLRSWGYFNVSFGRINGDFTYPATHAPNRWNHRGLKGSPREVNGNFSYYGSEGFNNLIDGPEIVTGFYHCNNSGLTSLEGAPREIGDEFSCAKNKLTTLKGGPLKVGSDFVCSNNPLINLEGSPREIGNDFVFLGVEEDVIYSLKGAPEKIGGKFGIKLPYQKINPVTGNKYDEIIYIDWSPKGWMEGFKSAPHLFAPLLILHGKEIPPGILNDIRNNHPDVWEEILLNLNPESAETQADLGELGF